MKDLATIGLPLQIAGFVGAIVALIVAAPHWVFVAAFAVHFVGDGLFFFQMKRQGCLSGVKL